MKRSSTLTWDQLRVALLILIALTVAAVAVYRLGQAANLFSKRIATIYGILFTLGLFALFTLSDRIKVKDSTIDAVKAKTTVKAMGRNSFPSTPCKVRIGR